MELGRRFRALFFFVAFVLCMSLCFVYAEDAPVSQAVGIGRGSAAPSLIVAGSQISNHLLLWMGPQRASFLQPMEGRIVEQHTTAAAPVATPAVLLQLEAATHSRRHLFLHGRTKPRIASPSPAMNESSILDLLLHQQLSSEAQATQAR